MRYPSLSNLTPDELEEAKILVAVTKAYPDFKWQDITQMLSSMNDHMRKWIAWLVTINSLWDQVQELIIPNVGKVTMLLNNIK